ncbi:MAG: NAD+ synthase [Gammaproteobacteria bacterium]|nr:NAD+ synthase [Gammaproteobacteria bacterium]MBT8094252.1 NAD+ synthase [Gammaproteobacteria bacterium]
MNDAVRVALAQVDLVVGDVAGNTARIIEYAVRARDTDDADIVVFPELSVCGYPPEDLLFHAGLRHDVEAAVEKVRREVSGIAVLLGFPEYDDDDIYNACAVLHDGKVLAHYRKHRLPNYAVFDEERYFKAGRQPAVFSLNGIRIGLSICEDVWSRGPMSASRAAGAECMLVINGSPFEVNSQDNRERAVRARVAETTVPVVYVNHIGGQDELVFDGGSFVMDADGAVVYRAPSFDQSMHTVELEGTAKGVVVGRSRIERPGERVERIYRALVRGTRDYVTNHGFPGVIIGLSGGVDSALVLAIACDAIGADKVRAVQMPFRYTAAISQEDSARQAQTFGIQYDVIPIEPMYEATMRQLVPVLGETEPDATEENIQSRCRGLLLMAISNKTGRMLLTTGNKSEMAVGYATLYGDMAGGFAPIKDCTKSLVYELARYRNTLGEAIPERVITREPSAELRPEQKDSDALPPYDVLDPILQAFIEDDLSVAEIEQRGFDRQVVIRVLEMVKRNEYKRRQAPPGVRISSRAFGRDWRYPITSRYTFPT